MSQFNLDFRVKAKVLVKTPNSFCTRAKITQTTSLYLVWKYQSENPTQSLRSEAYLTIIRGLDGSPPCVSPERSTRRSPQMGHRPASLQRATSWGPLHGKSTCVSPRELVKRQPSFSRIHLLPTTFNWSTRTRIHTPGNDMRCWQPHLVIKTLTITSYKTFVTHLHLS